MFNSEMDDDVDLITPEQKKILDDYSKRAYERSQKLTTRTVKEDGTIEYSWFLNSKNVICEKEEAIYKAIRTIFPAGNRTLSIEECSKSNTKKN